MYRICKHSGQCNLQFKQPNYFLTDRISTLVRQIVYLFIRPLICNVHDQLYKEKKLKFSTVFSTVSRKKIICKSVLSSSSPNTSKNFMLFSDLVISHLLQTIWWKRNLEWISAKIHKVKTDMIIFWDLQ